MQHRHRTTGEYRVHRPAVSVNNEVLTDAPLIGSDLLTRVIEQMWESVQDQG